MSAPRTLAWDAVHEELRARGLRGTPQRRLILDVLASTHGHVTTAQVLERCQQRDPETQPSTVYRTLDVLEELGYLDHSHGADGREEFHVLPTREHAHLRCEKCGRTWEMDAGVAQRFAGEMQRVAGFDVHVGHLSVAGICAECRGG
jgi:Fur family transcriptional regulator, ferric uptake regulator